MDLSQVGLAFPVRLLTARGIAIGANGARAQAKPLFDIRISVR